MKEINLCNNNEEKEALKKLDEILISDYRLKLVLKSALEKQITKKPKDHPLSDGKCPCCNAVFDYDWKPKSKFCQNCGQALDWGDSGA